MPSAQPCPPTSKQPESVDYFELSYQKSRERLLATISNITRDLSCLIDSRSIPVKGPAGETLATDFVQFGVRKPRQVLVISSGTHGVEGFAGSAIQHDFLTNRLPGLRLADDTAVVVIHANNPYGFAWLRRVSENNVDINRNFMDCFDPDRISADYEALKDILNPPDLAPENEAIRWQQIQRFAQEHGVRRTQRAITEGQYRYPHGLQFGGQARETCVENLLRLATEHLSEAAEILWIDVHTGLGEFGECELISGMSPESRSFQIASKIWPQLVSAEAGESLSSPLNGTMDTGLLRHLAPDCHFAMVSAEFGTHPVERVIKAMRADNWLHQYGPSDILNDPAARAIKAELLEAFRPDNRAWRQQIQNTGRTIIEQAISAMPGLQ